MIPSKYIYQYLTKKFGFLHNDVKPDNIYVFINNDNGFKEPRIIDLGSASTNEYPYEKSILEEITLLRRKSDTGTMQSLKISKDVIVCSKVNRIKFKRSDMKRLILLVNYGLLNLFETVIFILKDEYIKEFNNIQNRYKNDYIQLFIVQCNLVISWLNNFTNFFKDDHRKNFFYRLIKCS